MGHRRPGQGPVTTQVAERHPRVVPVVMAALGGLVLALAAASLTPVSLVRQFTVHHLGPGIVIVLIYAGVGVVIARQPAHVSRWIGERGG